jgi:predicted CXXCH cytochrome family protein
VGPCCAHMVMDNRPHRPKGTLNERKGVWGFKPVLPLVLGLAAVAGAAQQPPGSAIIATDRGTIVGPAGSPFNMPTDVAVGRGGRVYVLDGVNNRVVAYDAQGRLEFQFGGQGKAPGQFVYPLGIATDPNGNVYVADSGNHRFQVFTAEGRPREAVALPVTPAGPPPDPADVAVDSARHRLYLSDNDNHVVQVYNLADRRFEATWGSPGQGERQFRFPFLIDISAQGYLLVVEPINTRVQVLNPEGKFVGFVGAWGVEPGQLFRPKGVALWRERVLVTDSYLGNIQVFDLNGRFFGTLTDPTGTPLNLTTPTGIAIDANRNHLYVVELNAHQVRRLDLEMGSGKPQVKIGALGRLYSLPPAARANPPSASVADRNALPNPSRECAICHVRWVQAFGRGELPEGPMREVLERQAGSGEMCLSCHDGSVADSRFQVWSTRHHTTDAVPSPAVHIPTKIFPLDAQGRMTCATCHTAHAVAGDSDLRTVIFLRQPNIDSSLCLSCHPEHAQKSDRHHPLGHRDAPIPQAILDAGGKTSADGHSILCQTCHEPHGARNAWMLVLPPSELCVACHEDKAPEATPPAGAPVHRIGHTYAGFKPPQTLLDKRATFGPSGELSCLSCHRLHDASGVRPLLIQPNEDSSLCLGCHEKEKTVLGSPHDLRRSAPEAVNAAGQKAAASGPCGACHRIHGWARAVPETNRPHSSGCMECHKTAGPGFKQRPYVEGHPVGVSMPAGTAIPLPLDQATNDIGCLTCHNPHVPRSPEGDGNEVSGISRPDSDTGTLTPEPAAGVTTSAFPSPTADFRFLRRSGSGLCVLCHKDRADSLHGVHDPAQFEPALREKLGVPSSTGSCRVCHTAHSAQGPHLWARAPVGAAGSVSSLCQACHNNDSVKEPLETRHPLGVFRAERPRSDAALKESGAAHRGAAVGNLQSNEVSCVSCHDPHSRAAPGDLAETVCLGCHENKRGIQGSVHDPSTSPWAKDLGFVSKNLCLDCHPIHSPQNRGRLRDLLTGAKPSDDLCQACHGSTGPGPAVRTPHLDQVVPSDLATGIAISKSESQSAKLVQNPSDQGAAAARPSLEGADPSSVVPDASGERIRCTTCHDVHQTGQGAKLLRAARQDSALCLTCHAAQRALLSSPHDVAKSAPQAHNAREEPAAQSGSCGACHLVHPPTAEGGTWAQPLPPGENPAQGLCTGCHGPGGCAENRVPERREHPEVALLNRLTPEHPDYMPTFDEQGRPATTGVISCPTCHQVHAVTAGSAAEGTVNSPSYMSLRQNHQALCADCHGVQGLWRFLYFHKENRNPHRRPIPMYTP